VGGGSGGLAATGAYDMRRVFERPGRGTSRFRARRRLPIAITTDVRDRHDLSEHGIEASGRVVYQPTTALLYMHALARGDGQLAEGGPIVVDTGRHTGRSPKDKFVVREPGSEERIWWDGNNEIAEDAFERLRDKVTDFLAHEATLYVVDAFA